MFLWNIYWKTRDCWFRKEKWTSSKSFLPPLKSFLPHIWLETFFKQWRRLKTRWWSEWMIISLYSWIHAYEYIIRNLGWDERSLNIDPQKMFHPDFQNFPCHEIKLLGSDISNLCRTSRYLDHIKIGRADFDLIFLPIRDFIDMNFNHLTIYMVFSFNILFLIFLIFRVRYRLNLRWICFVFVIFLLCIKLKIILEKVHVG